jgi:hypothetical protein
VRFKHKGQLCEGTVIGRRDYPSCGIWTFWQVEEGLGIRHEFFEPEALEVYADGIRVLEIGGKLYRVTGHSLCAGYCVAEDGTRYPRCDANLEPLIPEKPAEPEPDKAITKAREERRFGKFQISRDMLVDCPHRVLEFFLRLKCLILKAEFIPENNATEYTVAHPTLPKVPLSQKAPLYMLAYSMEITEDGRKEEKIIGWDPVDERTEG